MKIFLLNTFKKTSFLLAILFTSLTLFSQSSDFYATYTRLDFDDNNNTGKYADIVINIKNKGKLVFSREYSYLPFWEAKNSKQFFENIIPFKGDGPSERPDRINKCSYVRIVENTDDKVIVHWRYAPDQTRLSFTDFKKAYNGDIGTYYAEFADEYFIVHSNGNVTRKVKKGNYSLDKPLSLHRPNCKIFPGKKYRDHRLSKKKTDHRHCGGNLMKVLNKTLILPQRTILVLPVQLEV